MSIASEITRISGKVSDSFDAVAAKGGTVTTRKIADLPTAIGTISGGGGGEWQPDPSWWDIKTILQNDTETYAGKAIILYNNSDDTTEFGVSGSVVAVKTSDGGFYTSTTTHTWDRTKDKPVSGDTGDTTPKFATRYVIIYLNTNTPYLSTFDYFKRGSMYAIFGCNLSASLFSYTFLGSNYTLIAFEFLNGYNFIATDFSNFCQYCYSLQKLPDVLDVSSGTNFFHFCSSCYSLQKLPDVLDTSSGISFEYFCYYCYSLQKLPDVLDVSSGTSFNQFCNGCYSLQKLPDGLDVSNGININNFCQNCCSLKELPDVLDVSSGTSFTRFCQNCYSLVKANIKLGNTSITTLSGNTAISTESLKYIADNAPTVSGLTLTIGSTNITRAGGASGEIITTLTNKGWTVN